MGDCPASTSIEVRISETARRYSSSFAVRLSLVALVHVVAYRVMDWFPFIESEAMPMWIPTGVSLFMLIWWSPKLWPGILAAEVVMGIPLNAEGLLESCANTLELTIASYLFLRFFKNRDRLFDLSGLIAALALGGVVAPFFAGSVVVAFHTFTRFTFVHKETGNILQWAIGDYNGVLLMLPLLVGFAGLPRIGAMSRWRRLELIAALGILVFCTGLVFDAWTRWFGIDLGNEVVADSFILTPILAWIAFRFAQPWTSLAFLLSATLGVWQTVHRFGPFAHYTYNGSVLWLEMFMAVGGTCSVLIAASRQQIDAAEARLSRSEETYRLLFMHNPHPMWVIDTETLRFIEVNQSAIEKYAYARSEFLNMTIRDIRPPEELAKLCSKLDAIRDSHRDFDTWLHRTKDGRLLDVEVTGCRYEVAGKPFRLVLAADITEKKQLEAELRQSQKLEALGRLAGGVAHDFNNLLMIMGSYAEMLQQSPLETERVSRHSQRILQAIERASSLTQQLLAFSRKQVLAPTNIDLNTVLDDTLSLIERLVGEDIEVRVVRGEVLCAAKLDAGQLTQVLLNLCSNARDAMFGHGILSLTTGSFQSQGIQLQGNGTLPAGSYSTLTVSDTGRGIDPALQEHIFEPFFTTKDMGKGTGLGLATVYGIVKQSGGYIRVVSSPGLGSEFTLYFPQAKDVPPLFPPSRQQTLDTGHGSILVAEDEPDLRAAIVDSLQALGYQVSQAVDGFDALQMARQLSALDLLVTDVVMPRMPGTELATQVRAKFPSVRVLLMSGYTNGSVEAEHLGPNTIFVPKPISLRALASNIRSLLTQAPVPQP